MKKASSVETGITPCRVAAGGDLEGSLPGAAQAPTRQKAQKTAWSLWLWVAAGFLFLGVLWTALFIASRKIDTRTVPLATQEAKP